MHTASLDVYRAFDNVQVTDVVDSLLELRFPLQLVYALLEGLAQSRADLSFQQVDVADIAWDSCIRTGSVEAPLFWLSPQDGGAVDGAGWESTPHPCDLG
eukprot:4063771-Pyramimonas_sp.AAC.1